MKEKELRLALVCFGGISLAVYIHGVTKEVLKLARASKAYHTSDNAGRRDEFTYGQAEPKRAGQHDTEAVYFDLLKEIGKHLDLRVIVDVAAGASAGGINAVILARALAHDLSIDHLRDLWLKEADVSGLMAEEARARIWSKWYMRPLIWTFLKFRLRRIGRDRELRSKLSGFIRSRWFKPPFDGEHLTALLFDGINAMGEPSASEDSLLPLNQRLELFVTVTDFHGYPRQVRLHDPPTITEREHRHILRFAYRRWPDGTVETDFDKGSVPGLAFAGRATASFPGAYPPAMIGEIDRLLAKRGLEWPGRESFFENNFARYRRAGVDPNSSAFIDGSVTNNKPFEPAIESIRERPAHREVDRRLVYIDPHPVEPGAVAKSKFPGFFRTLRGALSDIPRNEPIHDELDWISNFNAGVRRLKTIIEAARPSIAKLVTGITKGRINRAPSLTRLREWRDAANALAARETGFAYEGYVRLKLIDVLENVATLIAKLHGLPAKGQTASWIVEVLSAWARKRGIVPDEGPMPKAKRGTKTAKLPGWISLLLSFDFGFRRRRLHFVIQRLNELYTGSAGPGGKGLSTSQLDALKRAFYDSLALFGRSGLTAQLSEDTRTRAHDLLIATVPSSAQPDQVTAAANAYADTHESEIDSLVKRLAAEINLTDADRSVDEIFISREPERWPATARRELMIAYVGFSFWDVLTFSITQWRDLGEFDEIRVDRISPDDATAIRTQGDVPLLKGVGFRHFGAFFSRAHRENDYLWGRLHAADRLIDIVCDAARRESGDGQGYDLASLKKRAFIAILNTEEAHMSRSADLIRELRAEIEEGLS